MQPPSEEQVQQLVAMGFSRARVEQALRLSNNNVQAATEILLAGPSDN